MCGAGGVRLLCKEGTGAAAVWRYDREVGHGEKHYRWGKMDDSGGAMEYFISIREHMRKKQFTGGGP